MDALNQHKHILLEINGYKEGRRSNLSALPTFFPAILPFGADDNYKELSTSKSQLQKGKTIADG